MTKYRCQITAALIAAVVLSVSGCTPTDPQPTDSPTPSGGRESPVTSPTPEAEAGPVDTSGLEPGLGNIVRVLYTAGEAVPTSERLGDVLNGRTSPTKPLTAQAATGTWVEENIAVVVVGDDVTFLTGTGDEWIVVGGWWPSMNIADPQLGGQQHVLLIGGDAREGEGEEVTESRADTLQVVGVDGMGGGGIMGIARDLWVPLSTGGSGKINSAMVFGGPEAQQETVANATGLPVAGHMVIGFQGFTALVDEIGGLPIDAPTKVLDVPAGKSVIDGLQALRFARERKTLPGGDFDRSFNQGVLLLGFAGLTREMGALKLPEVLALVQKHIDATNLSAEQVLTLAGWSYVAQPAQFGHDVAKGPFGTRGGGQSVVLIGEEAEALFDDFADGNLTP